MNWLKTVRAGLRLLAGTSVFEAASFRPEGRPISRRGIARGRAVFDTESDNRAIAPYASPDAYGLIYSRAHEARPEQSETGAAWAYNVDLTPTQLSDITQLLSALRMRLG